MISLREACVAEDEAQKFNLFMEMIKKRYTVGANKEFFEMVRKERVSLITKDESSISSTITKQEAEQFLFQDAQSKVKAQQQAPKYN